MTYLIKGSGWMSFGIVRCCDVVALQIAPPQWNGSVCHGEVSQWIWTRNSVGNSVLPQGLRFGNAPFDLAIVSGVPGRRKQWPPPSPPGCESHCPIVLKLLTLKMNGEPGGLLLRA